MDLKDLFDSYGRQARLQPALLVVFPGLVSVAIWFPQIYKIGTGLAALAVACGVTVLLSHVARVKGRSIQPKLFDKWGGTPTTQWLRHSDDHLDAVTKRRYHDFLAKNIAGWTAPTLQDELDGVPDVDVRYETAVKWILEKTRDQKQFPLVLKENTAYGFRRNLLGLKPIGLAISLLATVGCLIGYYWNVTYGGSIAAEIAIGSVIVNMMISAAWIFVVRDTWVRDAADSFARALLAACDQLG